MAPSKLFMLFASLIIGIAPYQEPEDSISSLRIELDQLKSKVSFLESSIEKSNQELKSKDESIAQMKKIILEKAESISSLQNNIDCLQQEGPIDAKRQMNEPHAHVVELEKQVDKIKKEIEMLDKKKIGLEVRANVADKKIQELNLKLENVQKANKEQKTTIQRNEQLLQVAEEEMLKSKLDATFMESVEDNQWWLPHWLVVRFRHFQSFIVARWNYCWRPALDESFQKILVKLSHIQTDTEMCIETIKIEWMPVMKEQWLAFISYLKPYAESLTAKTIEVYHACKNSLVLHTVKVQRAMAPFILEAHRFAEPYLDEALITLEPYSKKPVCAYRKIVTCAVSYHKQIQQVLKTNELTRSLATMDLAWFAATALLCLPLVFMCRLHSAIFRKKARKSRYNSHTNHTRRRAKRPYPH